MLISPRFSRWAPAALALSLAATAAITPEGALANTPEDVQGVHARTIAMGGAGTALGNDFSSVYYNPAGLSFCETSQIGTSIRHTFDGYGTSGTDAPDPKELRDQTRVSAGICNHLPFNLSAGIMFGAGLQNQMTLDQTTLNDTPQFVMAGEHLEMLSIGLGVAYRPKPWLSVGLGGSILVHSALGFGSDIPLAVDRDGDGMDDTAGVSVRWDLQPVGAAYVGVMAEPTDGLRLGVTYRGSLFHKLDTPASISVDAFGIIIDVDLLVESVAWFSPRQLAFGASYRPVPEFQATFDLTWYQWSQHPGPFIVLSPQAGETCGDPDNSNVACELLLPPREDARYRNIVVPRVGGEVNLLDRKLAVRGGYSYRPSVVPRPSVDQLSSLLDGNVHSFSLGAGYTFGERPDPERGEPVGASRSPSSIGEVNATVDAFFRASVMGERRVEARPTTGVNAFRYGGTTLDLGVAVTLGWY